MPATAQKTSVAARFLRYVTFDTQSSEKSDTSPTTAKQLVLADQLVKELKELGIQDAARNEFGIVFATIPATSKKNVPVIGLVSHVDTSPESSGAGVKPIVHTAWRGEDIVLPDDPSIVLRAADHPELKRQIGNDIITASGTTLLGADDKAGVAEIMAATEYLLRHPEIAHGPIRIGFTPDEEVGRGTDKFDIQVFGAKYAYTMDGEVRGTMDVETFSADSMVVEFRGFNTHPGFAKGKMINSIRVAADFLSRVPRDRMSPETTEKREGFVHPYMVDSSVDRTAVKFIIRDFRTGELKKMEDMLERLAQETVAAWPGAKVSVKVQESYRNLGDVLAQHPAVVDNAREAYRRSGLEPIEAAIRGGTDGSRLSAIGLPTPNLFTGMQNFHSKQEWVSVQDMEKAVEVIVNLVRVWEERA
ncbi:MAG: peptidase T [Candidatus Eiseniibacteriota bacterium]